MGRRSVSLLCNRGEYFSTFVFVYESSVVSQFSFSVPQMLYSDATNFPQPEQTVRIHYVATLEVSPS